ncbi:hypothetical protein DRE_00970 [Drechslerella stenobrocha 248]|uniref:DUF7896 domain-containing protein n=1 Tax=Drechslerella stenobrocha 248 TaxID=1043628 RepID=W7HLM8_9PEZI|nr:hypothetical protein DRE_00970 [Drechslerella stenobrocha 248]
MDTPSGAAHDPVRQQFLRHLHEYLSQITKEAIQENGSNFDKQKRNDRFYSSLKYLADYVVRFNDKREKTRESASASRAAAAEYAPAKASAAPSNASMHMQPAGSVALQNSELGTLLPVSLPKDRGFPETRITQESITGMSSGAGSRQSVSPTVSLEASFSSMPSLQGGRTHSSDSASILSAPRPPAITNPSNNGDSLNKNAPNSHSFLQSNPTNTTANFGFAARQRGPAPPMPPLQAAAISTTAGIEATLVVANDLINPRRDVMMTSAHAQPQFSGTAPNNNDSADNASGSRKRKRQKKQWCPFCNDHKEGFRGPHELSRHMNIQHQTKKTVYIVCDDSIDKNMSMFKDCKHCSRRKIYGQDYNAACHLRRAHFNKRLKTDTPEEREFKQLHPDFPPMEELRPWLRKCLVDVSKLKEKKYIDNQDEAILKIEPAVKHDELSSSDQEQDHFMSDDEGQPDGPATPPPEPQSEPETQNITPEVTMGDSMLQNSLIDFDFDFSFDSTGAFENTTQNGEFIFNSQPAAPSHPQPSATPRTNDTSNIFAAQWQLMGIQPTQIGAGKVPDFIDPRAMYGMSYDMHQFNGNSVEVPGAGEVASLDNFDIDQFLHGAIMNSHD